MNFAVGSFAKIDNLNKMCNLDNSCKNPYDNWQIFPILHFLQALKTFPNFSFASFHWKITWYLGKINKKVKTERVGWRRRELTLSPHVWGLRVSTCPLVYCLKQPINYCCRIFTILCMIFKKHLFIVALCSPIFIKYAHCKPLFPFQNNA